MRPIERNSMWWEPEEATAPRTGWGGRLLAAGVLLALQACSSTPARPVPHPLPPVAARPRQTPPADTSAVVPVLEAVRVRTAQGDIRVIGIEDYVAGVVAGELAIGAIDPRVVRDMLAVQAILARTYAVANAGRHAREGFDLCSSTHCQVYRTTEQVLVANRPLAASAAAATTGQVLAFGGRPAQTLFHANCGGRTSAPERIWGGEARPYLRPVTDESCRLDPAAAWSYALTRTQARDALNATPRTAVGARLDAIAIVETDDAGRAALVALDGEKSPLVRGEELRAAIMRQLGDRTVRSPMFVVRRDGERFVFTGRGRGHGAGLCQHGALARLLAGASVGAVLSTYYPGTLLTESMPARLTLAPSPERYARR